MIATASIFHQCFVSIVVKPYINQWMASYATRSLVLPLHVHVMREKRRENHHQREHPTLNSSGPCKHLTGKPIVGLDGVWCTRAGRNIEIFKSLGPNPIQTWYLLSNIKAGGGKWEMMIVPCAVDIDKDCEDSLCQDLHLWKRKLG